jgi:hypothetical protein
VTELELFATELELFAAYGVSRPVAEHEARPLPSPESADDIRRRLVSELRREDSGASGLPSRPTGLPPADAIYPGSVGRRLER